MSDERKWCYLPSTDSEEAYGPFDTRELAVGDARRMSFDSVVLARCNFADPGEELSTYAAERLMEELEEDCDDMLRNPEDPTFSFVDGVSSDDLDSMLRVWLRKNVKATWFCADPDTYENVRIGEKHE